jgi:hypothetical protein
MTGKVQRELTTGHPSVGMRFLDKNQIIIHSVDRLRIWNLDDPQIVKEFEFGKYGVLGAIGPWASLKREGSWRSWFSGAVNGIAAWTRISSRAGFDWCFGT